ncbi:glycerol-3-phosphate acyltransferase [Paenisporosarcina sp. NPDC076898]|uniref:glycerol-3-phosphate acyltransferase n=1 Tax=unclassified Paenisporosarcina TaxID=2642018 RepID=UPI003D087E92
MNLALSMLIVLLSGYLIGCLHGSFVAQLLSGVNVKEQGIKNAGASNATIVLGKKYGALVALIDIGKSIFAIGLLRLLLGSTAFSVEVQWVLLFLMGAFVVIGHNYPFWMNFDGGKGTASVIGVLLVLDWKIGLAGLLLLIVISLVTDYLLIGVLFLYITFIILALWVTESFMPLVITIALFLLAIWKHRENIQRLKDGTEPRVSSVIKKKKAVSTL